LASAASEAADARFRVGRTGLAAEHVLDDAPAWLAEERAERETWDAVECEFGVPCERGHRSELADDRLCVVLLSCGSTCE
jgi:hypothetical protein